MPATDPHPQEPPPQQEPPGRADHDALMARLYREHNQALLRFLRTRVESEAEARDVAQEAYVRMLQLDRKDAVSFLSGYLFKTAANIAIDRARSRATHRRVTHDICQTPPGPELGTPERLNEARQEIELIERCVEELPAKCRQAFYLHRLHDASPAEIAAQLGVSTRMVHLYLVRALAHLRARIEGEAHAKENAR